MQVSIFGEMILGGTQAIRFKSTHAKRMVRAFHYYPCRNTSHHKNVYPSKQNRYKVYTY
jgi:hypothetical protein